MRNGAISRDATDKDTSDDSLDRFDCRETGQEHDIWLAETCCLWWSRKHFDVVVAVLKVVRTGAL